MQWRDVEGRSDFASHAVNLAKLSRIFMTIWCPHRTAPLGVAGLLGHRYTTVIM